MSKNKKILATVLAVIIALVIVGCMSTSAQAAPSHRPSATKCAKQINHLHSATAKQCRRMGWTIEKDWYPADETFTVYKASYLVVSPTGRVYVDTLCQLGCGVPFAH